MNSFVDVFLSTPVTISCLNGTLSLWKSLSVTGLLNSQFGFHTEILNRAMAEGLLQNQEKLLNFTPCQYWI